jgi:hypothetical protein
VKDAEGYVENPKTAAQAEKGYAHKAQCYAIEESTSHPSLCHLGKIRGSSHTSLEAS